ncbi:MAG TPA: SDR family oxidoreductase [Pyrinomonadaceae bacterium]|nr:SDR family oxidoreductase [Pyrinomonadaceae bacterium]
MMIIDLTGKTALVTASSKGIGFGISKALLAAGANVCICSRNEDNLRTAESELAQPDRVLAITGDVADAAFLKELVSRAVDRFKVIDILVNNSGGPPAGEALSLTEEQWLGAINGNLLSVIRLSSLVIPQMKNKGWGRIVNLTSTAAREPGAGMALSNVTRAGVAAYTKTLAQEVGPFGITVNTILTGGVLTDRLNSLLERSIKDTGETFDEAIARIEKTIPVRHLSTPEEFAQTTLFLVSPQASYINGAAIAVDGGASKSTF